MDAEPSAPPKAVQPYAEFHLARDPLREVIFRNINISRGRIPLEPVNRLFANFSGMDNRAGRLLRERGIDPNRQVCAGGEIATAELVRLMRRTQLLARDELWGLCPEPVSPGTFAQACRLAVHAPSIEQALRIAFRFYHGSVKDFTLRLMREDEWARIVVFDTLPQRPGRDILHLFVLQTLRATLEWLSGRANVVESLNLQYAPLPDADTISALFGATCSGEAVRTSLVIHRSVLARAVAAEPGQVSHFVMSLPGKLAMVNQDQRTLADRAASYIRTHSDWGITREAVAAALHMSAATFWRQLHRDIGVGFQELKDQLRYAAALELIEVDGVSLDEVARMLGFAELSSFHRAFKRWTGHAPGAYRCKHSHHAGVHSH